MHACAHTHTHTHSWPHLNSFPLTLSATVPAPSPSEVCIYFSLCLENSSLGLSLTHRLLPLLQGLLINKASLGSSYWKHPEPTRGLPCPCMSRIRRGWPPWWEALGDCLVSTIWNSGLHEALHDRARNKQTLQCPRTIMLTCERSPESYLRFWRTELIPALGVGSGHCTRASSCILSAPFPRGRQRCCNSAPPGQAAGSGIPNHQWTLPCSVDPRPEIPANAPRSSTSPYSIISLTTHSFECAYTSLYSKWIEKNLLQF